jgi:HK97 family phage portal protein
VLVAADGSVFYQLHRGETNVTGAWPDTLTEVTVPAREIIHDRIHCLFHPLVGLSPLYAAGMPAALGSTILRSSTQFFATGSRPSGTLSSANEITQAQAEAMQQRWQTGFGGVDNTGKIAVLGYGLKYEALTQTAVDAQLNEQASLTEIEICKCFGFPVALLNSTKGAPYNTHEQLVQLYHDECLQPLLRGTELALDEGLHIDQPVNGTQYGTEFDIDDLYWMDTATRTKAAADSVGSGVLSPNEARLKYFGLGPVKGGDSPMVQQQYYSLAALAERDKDKPFATPTPATPASSPEVDEGEDTRDDDDETEDTRDDDDDDTPPPPTAPKKKPTTN